MKKSLLALFLFSALGLYGQTIEETQMTLITKRTATWCPNCGTYGWTLFRNLIDDNSEKAILVAAHFGGSALENPTSIALSGNFQGSGQPKFFVNNELQTVNSGNIDVARQTIASQVNLYFQQDPTVGFGMNITEAGGTYSLDGKIRFLDELEGEFYLSAFVIEETVIANQSSVGSDAEHKQILSGALTEDDFADFLVDGTITAGTEFDFDLEVIDPADAANLEIAIILWQKEESGFYTFVNGYKKGLDETITVGTSEPSTEKYGSLQILDLGQDAQLQVVNKDRQQVQINLVDLQGRVVHSFHQGMLNSGVHYFELPADVQLGSGIYVVQALWNDQFILSELWVNP
jgi:hypothetical protein